MANVPRLVFGPQPVANTKHRSKINIGNVVGDLVKLCAFVASQIEVKSGLKVKPFPNKKLIAYATAEIGTVNILF